MQKTLIIIGLGIVVIGLAWPLLSKLPIGRLPGDLLIRRDGFTVYLPITTMLLVSALLSLILWLFRQ